jgi:hypothetical protein
MATGLSATDTNNPRLHFDIYAILEGSQEMYLGHEVQVNVNIVETVKLATKDGRSLEKCYISPTKRRGVERRCLIWAPVKSGVLLGDKQDCGIPNTCALPTCPICASYGGLIAGKKTLIGRVTHGGGVAIQDIYPQEKQRAMHPAILSNDMSKKEEKPTLFKRQYNQPGILYPVSNHGVSITDKEFASVAYAFLDALPRIGSGNPKGIAIAEETKTKIPLLVVDRYLVPRGKRPIISPSITDPQEAIADFIRLSTILGTSGDHLELPHFDRWIGDAALAKLQDYSGQFVDEVLQKD